MMRSVEYSDSSQRQSLQEYLNDKIDSQIEAKNHVDQHAGRLLSIWLTFIGIFITIGIAVSSGRISPPIQPLEADTISNELGFLVAILGDGAAEIVFVAVFFIGGFAAIATMVYLFIWAPYQALSVLKADTPEHWISVTDHKLMDSNYVKTVHIIS